MSLSENTKGASATTLSKDLPPWPDNFAPIFFRNQFRTTIELPTKAKYPSVKDRCAIVTGSNTGIGLEASQQLLSLGLSHLVMGVRSLSKGNHAASKLRAQFPQARVDVWELDMLLYPSIQAFADKCRSLSRIDMVIFNAGMAPFVFETVPETGHEQTIQTNHLGTMLLGILMLPVLKAHPRADGPPCMTFVNSATAHLCALPMKDDRPLLPSFDNAVKYQWSASDRYGASKLLCQLAVVRLAEQIDSRHVIINMVDPGLTKGTGLGARASGLTLLAAKAFIGIAGRRVDVGAATYVDAVLGHGQEAHGCFLVNCEVAPLSKWYSRGGDALVDAVWAETLDELAFANVGDILKG